MEQSRLHQVYELGQSVWYDNIRRGLITSGDLQRLIDEDAVVGVTSNPTIFEKAIAGSSDYDDALRTLVIQGVRDPRAIFDALAVEDIQNAANLLRPIYDRTNKRDGYISLEVAPDRANDTEGTIADARRLFAAVNRPNVMIKIPATAEGIPAIEQMIYEGVNINVTLIFSLDVYQQVTEAFIRGLERRVAEGKPVDAIASVASFFVSRVDTLVDKLLEEKIAASAESAEQEALRELRGTAAIANARLAYEKYEQIFHGERFAALAAAGAQPQRCLWASTSTKNPAYRDVLYVEELIGPETVDTMPPQTIVAFQDHGVAERTLGDYGKAHKTMKWLASAGIDMDQVTKQLEIEGVKSFFDSFTSLLESTAQKTAQLAAEMGDHQASAETQQAAPSAEQAAPSAEQAMSGGERMTPAFEAVAVADPPAEEGKTTPEPTPMVHETLAAEATSPAEHEPSAESLETAPVDEVAGEPAASGAETLEASVEPEAEAQAEAQAEAEPEAEAEAQAEAEMEPSLVGRASLGALQGAVTDTLGRAQSERFAQRVWQKDPAFWKPNPAEQREITDRLGWLTVTNVVRDALPRLNDLRDTLKNEGMRDVVLLGMGGSSLAPEVLRETFGVVMGLPNLHVLDSTDPATIRAIEQAIDLAHTVFIVASKSGGTLETLSQYKYFYAKVSELAHGDAERAGSHFIAITDPGTKLDAMAQERRFRTIFRNPADIGGRYSALSFFGMVPAAIIGIDVEQLLDRADAMRAACAPDVAASENPGVWLGTILGLGARQGRDKVTIVVSPPIATFGYWLEQLLAESTGKEGKGILPVEGEALGDPSVYGSDRIFAYLRTDEGFDPAQDAAIERLEAAGQPVVRLKLHDIWDMSAEFYRWEFATAVAGALMGINAFDQPNVQESKDNTDRILARYAETHELNEPSATLRTESGHVSLVAQGPQAERLRQAAASLQAAFELYTREARPGDYFALLAYIQRTPETEAALQRIRLRLRDGMRDATTLGYGPRFQHSTGQLHKGGANTGLFLQFVADTKDDLSIPDAPYTFGTLKAAQALGDLQSLQAHGRRAIRIDLHSDIAAGLAEVEQALNAARIGQP